MAIPSAHSRDHHARMPSFPPGNGLDAQDYWLCHALATEARGTRLKQAAGYTRVDRSSPPVGRDGPCGATGADPAVEPPAAACSRESSADWR